MKFTWFTVATMSQLFFPLLIACFVACCSNALEPTTSNQPKPQSPTSSLESLKWLEVEPGYQVELVASEPQIVDPVSMQIDAAGCIWVVEMGDYPFQETTPRSRVVVLQDKNKDGFFESSTVFADKLLFATGVQPWQNGALVTVQGQLLMLRDTDGDLRSDSTELWLDGFSTGNPQLRANHPVIAADGWLYIASGLRGGKIKATLPFGSPSSELVDLTGCDLRVHMLTGQIESIAGPTQFGLSFDQFGHRYGCSNRQPCFEIVSERADLSLSPLSGLATAIHEVSPSNAASKVQPLVNAWTTSNLHAGQFTAACGMIVTHSRHFPDAPFATALTCEPTGSLVQRRSIMRSNGVSQITDEAPEKEWLASHDPWFRPVDLYEGPGGDIYVVDMYRAVIEHPDWVPVELKKRPDERMGDSHGRIYRVSRKTTNPTPKESRFSNPFASASDWLTHPDYWNRSIAARMVLEASANGKDELLNTKLREICTTSTSQPIGSIASACSLLAACDAIDEPTVKLLIKSSNPELRSLVWSAMRQTSMKWATKWIEKGTQTFANPNATLDEMRAAAWFVAAQETNVNSENETMNQFAVSAAKSLFQRNENTQLWMAITAASRNNLSFLLTSYLNIIKEAGADSARSLARDPVVRLASRIAQQCSDSEAQGWIQTCTKELSDKSNPATRKTSFAILEGFFRSGKLSIVPDSVLDDLIQRSVISDQDPVNQRAAVAIMATSKSDAAKALALKLLDSTDSLLLKSAIATCSVHDTPEFATWLLSRLPSALPEIRPDVFNAIRNNPKRLSMLVDELESGSMSPKLFDASQIQSLNAVRESSIAPRLSKVLSASINTDRQKVIDDYSQQISTLQVDTKDNRGKAVFVKNCSACHRMDGVGTMVGPDISDSRVHTFEKLLISILDPNRSIDANYFRYLARTEDGNVVEGLLKDANAQTITLLSQNGTVTTLNRSEIEELKSSGTSLMPEGIETQISVREMADLLWYVKNWRYTADGVPANATIK
ncbi:MAG TPA: PVC-type heme-binding CxxCH protein [Pirellula sp.]|nr:PVC-type heme-binding CxxCH protein [Pirellula sp.]